MKKEPLHEEYKIGENNVFEEFQEFKAEDYRVKENIESPLEVLSHQEILGEDISHNQDQRKNVLEETRKIKQPRDIGTSIVSHSSILFSSTVLVVSASMIGVVSPIISSQKNTSKITIEESSLREDSSPDAILIRGKIKNINLNYVYFIYVNQYKGAEAFDEAEKNYLEIEDKQGNFSFLVDAYYGLTNYQYEIGYYDENEVSTILYTSQVQPFTISQAYNATYDKVTPNQVEVTYISEEEISLQIQTNFHSENEYVFMYGLDILDLDGNVYQSYVGTEPVLHLVIPFIEQICFVYSDIGVFRGESIILASYPIDEYRELETPTTDRREKDSSYSKIII